MTHTNGSPEILTVVRDNLADLTRSVGAFPPSRHGDDLAILDLRGLLPSAPDAEFETATVDISAITRWERALRGVERARVATVALLGPVTHGHALEIALCCDFRIAPAPSRLWWTDEARGIWPSTAVHRLVRLLGPAGARRFLLLDRSWDAETALAHALVDVITDDPFAEVARLRQRLAPVRDMRVVRQLLEEAASTAYDDALGAHLAACDRTLRRTDAA